MKAIISYNDPKSVISEQYRAIRTNIEYSNVDQNTKTILVTRSDKKESKKKTESVEKKYLEETKKKLDAVDARILGAILNSYKSEQKDYNYYSYYGK